MNTYIVIEQGFFISHNCDYAMAFDPHTDMEIFSNKEKANNYFEDRAEELCRTYGEFIDVSYGKDKIYMWMKTGGSRHYLKLIKKNVN